MGSGGEEMLIRNYPVNTVLIRYLKNTQKHLKASNKTHP